MYWFFAFRNLVLMRRRYYLISLGIMLGFAMISVLTSLSDGVLRTMYNKAALYFSGEISLINYEKERNDFVEHSTQFAKDLQNSDLPLKYVSPRTIDYKSDFPIFFGGEKARVRRIIGVDFENEIESFRNSSIIAGNVDDLLTEKGQHGIILSSATAEYLHAKIGDDITIMGEVAGDSMFQNSGTYVLTAIFREQNFFGYACYLHRKDLNLLMGYPEDASTEYAVFTKDGENFKETSFLLYDFLQKTKCNPLEPCLSRDQYASARELEGYDYFIVPLEGSLSTIQNLIHVFLICVYFVLIVFLAIMVVGILNTYKVLVYERIREIGTMRAIGMQKNSVKKLFLYEAFLLALFSAFIGFFIALLTLSIISTVDLTELNLINFFTVKGHLRYYISMKSILQNLFLITITVLFAVLKPAKVACNINPVEALRQE